MDFRRAMGGSQKKLQLVSLTELWLKAEDANKYAEKFHSKLEEYEACKKWSKRLELCRKNIDAIQIEMTEVLKKNGGFREIE